MNIFGQAARKTQSEIAPKLPAAMGAQMDKMANSYLATPTMSRALGAAAKAAPAPVA